jgi:ABC-type sugar transport system ATPase subunit
MGYVPQDLALFPHLQVLDNILFGPRIQGRLDRAARALATELMGLLGIAHLAERSPRLLSGGERQRVALARALASGSRLLLLDEPFASLNEGLRREFWMTLKLLQETMGLTVLLITHDLEEAFFLGDQVSVLIEGTIQQTSSAQALYRRPATLQVAKHLGITNLFPGTLTEFSPGHASVLCRGLGLSLAVEVPPSAGAMDPLTLGDPVVVGIRADEVKVVRPGFEALDAQNSLRGSVTAVYNRGSSHTVVVRPQQGAGANVDIDVSSRTLAKLGLTQDAELTIALKASRILLFPDTRR